jgi:hypothetical protein
MRRRDLLLWIAVAPLAARRAFASSEAYQVIVHPDSDVTGASRDFLRRVWLKKATTWPGGATVRPIDLPRDAPARGRFTREVIKKSPSQLRSYWNQQIFSGKGVPPPEADSLAAAISYVLDHPGAVAYVPADTDLRGAKVLDIT